MRSNVATVPAEVHGPGDAELIDSVRNGSTSAFGDLYQRHVSAAYNLARQLARSPAEADDLVSDAFAKVLDTLRDGRGPDVAFRAYLLTTLRHTAYDRTRKERKVELSDDVTAVSGVDTDQVSVPFSDTAVAGLERSLAARAFATLPERWQAVLWHTEIEGQSPAEVAPHLGISANGVSALAYRAREGLRQAYLQVHLAETEPARCRSTVDRLGAWTRGGLAKRENAQVEAHLDECDRCRALAAELADVNGALRVVLAPVVLGVAAGGYLATTSGTANVAAATATSAAAGSASGAAGAASAGPRQLLGVGASAAALAAAVAVGALAHTGAQQIPTAASPPTPSSPAPGAPHNPAPPPNKPAPHHPSQPQPPKQSPPASSQHTPSSPGSRTPNPPQGEPSLSVHAPPVTLKPDDGVQPLPLTVRNNGDAASGPVTATLHLPHGVTAIGSSSYSTQQAVQPAAYTVDSAAAAGAAQGTVHCPGGTGTVKCAAPHGLEPGESVTLVFKLKADESAPNGATITGSVGSTGEETRVSVHVPVRVQHPVDRVSVSASGNPYKVNIDVTNTGDTTEPFTITIDTKADPLWGSVGMHCDPGETTTCTSIERLAEGEHERVALRLCPPCAPRTVTVTATLGNATRTTTVDLRWGRKHPGPPGQGVKPPHPDPTPTPTATPTVTHGPDPGE